MPTIQQLPAAIAVSGNDVLPLSQNGLTRGVTITTLLSGTQQALALSQGSLIGRASPGLGGAESISVGTGLTLLGGAVTANAQDHLSLPMTSILQSNDEVILNSNLSPRRLPASKLRSLFSAGSGVAIDENGVISSTSGSSTGGAQGQKGDPGPQGPAGQGFNFRGGWLANTAYAANDVIVYGGQTFMAASAFTSGSSFDIARFTLLAAQGSIGPAGPQGAAGAQGPSGLVTPATSSAIGAVKPGAGLTLAADGTISVGSVNLSSLAQSGATIGQVLGWTGVGWGPTTGTSGGVATFNSRVGPVSLTLSDVTTVLGTGAGARASLGLAAVAVTGSYADLSGAPAIPSGATSAPLMNGAASAGSAASFARSDHVHPADASRLAAANNLADVVSSAVARTNLGLGGAALLNVGSSAATVAAGNDARIVSALQPSAIPAANNQLLGGSGSSGTAAAVLVGAGLALSGGTLSATGGGTGNYTLSPASTSTLGGVKPDGTTLTATSDGTLTVAGIAVTALTDISAIGGPALTDLDIINRNGNDYKSSVSARLTLFRKTPAGSRTVALAAGSTTATLTALDHDKTVVITGSVAGSLAVDASVGDGFRCQVINHTGSSLALSGITGLQGASTLPNNGGCWISFANATVEALVSGAGSAASAAGSNGQVQVNSNGSFAGVTLGGDTTFNASTGALTVTKTNGAVFGTAATLNVGVVAGTVAAGNDSRVVGALQPGAIPAATAQLLGGSGTAGAASGISVGAGLSLSGNTLSATTSYTLPIATSSALGGVKQGSGVTIAADGTLNATGAATAYMSAGVSGIVSSLPGGPGAVVFRNVFSRPCSFAANLNAPYTSQAQAGTLPSTSASFGLAKRAAGTSTTVAFGSIAISPSGAVTATATATSFAAGDQLVITAPNPSDSNLADVAIAFTGTWG